LAPPRYGGQPTDPGFAGAALVQSAGLARGPHGADGLRARLRRIRAAADARGYVAGIWRDPSEGPGIGMRTRSLPFPAWNFRQKATTDTEDSHDRTIWHAQRLGNDGGMLFSRLIRGFGRDRRNRGSKPERKHRPVEALWRVDRLAEERHHARSEL